MGNLNTQNVDSDVIGCVSKYRKKKVNIDDMEKLNTNIEQ